MLFTNKPDSQVEYELVCLEHLVEPDHLLRHIEQYIDFTFILDLVRPFYSETNGRPSLDPIVFFKMLLIGYLYGIRSERELERVVNDTLSFRWFLKLGLSKNAPDHSVFSWNRKNRYRDTDVIQTIFDRIVEQAKQYGLIGGRMLTTDSTHIKANANNSKYEKREVLMEPQAYLRELEQAVNEDRVAHGKKPLPDQEGGSESKVLKVSLTDPDSGYMTRDGKPEGFYYLDHRTVDHKYNIITDCHVTAGNVNDSVVYIERLQRQVEKFGFANTLESVALDSGYMTAYVCYKTSQMDILAAIPERHTREHGVFPKTDFIYDAEKNVYLCPNQQELTYRSTTREGHRDYKSNPKLCAMCPLLSQCTTNQNKQRTVQRHIWEECKERVIQYIKSVEGKAAYRLRCQTIERSFADAKVLHGLRYCRFRGRQKVQEQVLLTAVAQNIKKIAMIMSRKERMNKAWLSLSGWHRKDYNVLFSGSFMSNAA